MTGLWTALARRQSLGPLAIVLISLCAIPLMDLSGVIRFSALSQTCLPEQATALINGARYFVTLLSVTLVILANFWLFNYLVVISGRTSGGNSRDKQAAILMSGLLFLGLIMAYAALYFIHFPCLDFVYRDRTGARRVIAEMITNFYFSAVTVTTFGYGDFTPKYRLAAELIAACEALNGLVAFSIFTGTLAGFAAARNAPPDGDAGPKR